MEEDKLNKLFKDFDPELSSDFNFMDRLKRNLESVEIVKSKNVEAQTIRRRALVIAALTGFVAGFLSCLFLPVLSGMVESLFSGGGWLQDVVAQNPVGVSLIIVTALTALMSLSAYDISLAVIKKPGKRD